MRVEAMTDNTVTEETTATAPSDPEADAPVAISTDAVLAALDAIRPALQADGGDIGLVDITPEGIVSVRLVGACGTCPASTMTLKAGVERILKDRVPGVLEVVAV